MLFYRLSGTITGAKEIEACKDRYDRMDWAGTINFMTSAFNQMHQENVFFFVSDILEKSVSIGIINRSISDIEQYIKPYLEAIELNLIQTVLDEIKIVRLKSMLRNASRGGFIDNDREVLELLELDGISRHSPFGVSNHHFKWWLLTLEGHKGNIFYHEMRILKPEKIIFATGSYTNHLERDYGKDVADQLRSSWKTLYLGKKGNHKVISEVSEFEYAGIKMKYIYGYHPSAHLNTEDIRNYFGAIKTFVTSP